MALRWQVLTVRVGLVTEIVGFDDRTDASLGWACRRSSRLNGNLV